MINNNYDMTFTDLMIKDENNNLIDYRSYKGVPLKNNIELLKYHIKYHITGTPTFMYKKSVLEKIGGFENVRVGQEFVLMLKTIKNKVAIGYMKKSYVVAYVHQGERISVGKNKIIGENELFKMKKSYYYLFTKREIYFIKFRHYAVKAVAEYRAKNYLKFILNSILAFLSSPIDFLYQPMRHLYKIIKKGVSLD